MKRIVTLIVALILGVVITWVDSQPTWDDTGVTALGIFLTCAVLSAIESSRPWLTALVVGSGIPIVGVCRGNLGAALALLFAFAGAYFGMGIGRALGKTLNAKPT